MNSARGLAARKRGWLVFLLVFAVLAILAPLGLRRGDPAPHAETDRLARHLVTAIVAGSDPGRSLCRLIALHRYYRTPRYQLDPCVTLPVRQVIASPGERLTTYAAIVASNLVDDPAPPHAGELILFDSHGYLVPVYGGANLLDGADGVIAYRGGAPRAVVHVINTSAGDGTAQVLHVVPIAEAQRSVLSVIVGPPALETCEGFSWSWRARDSDGDGIDDIEIGPLLDRAGAIEPRATYHWSADRGSYEGPSGSAAAGFLRTDQLPGGGACCDHHTKAFAEEWSRLGPTVPRDAVRRPTCSTSMETSLEPAVVY